MKCYITFVISGIASQLFLSSEKISPDLVYRVATIRVIPAYSEFLLSFVVITMFGAILKREVDLVTQRWAFLLAFIAASFAFSFFSQNFSETDPLISVFIGSKQFHVFPIMQYLPLFLLGVFTARNTQFFQMRSSLFFSIIGAITLLISALIKAPITRFPPSVIWILISIGLVFLYRGLAMFVSEKFPNTIKHYQITLGQNVLFYLLISNLMIFIGNLYKPKLGLGPLQTVIVYILIMGLIFFLQTISNTSRQVAGKTNQ
jgi:hypothetical protein